MPPGPKQVIRALQKLTLSSQASQGNMYRPLANLSDEELGLLLYRSAAALAEAANLQKQNPQLKNTAITIRRAADPLTTFDELERTDPALAKSVLSTALATLAEGHTMYSTRKEMKRRIQESN